MVSNSCGFLLTPPKNPTNYFFQLPKSCDNSSSLSLQFCEFHSSFLQSLSYRGKGCNCQQIQSKIFNFAEAKAEREDGK